MLDLHGDFEAAKASTVFREEHTEGPRVREGMSGVCHVMTGYTLMDL